MIATISRWNEWFEATGDEETLRTWNAAKHMYKDPIALDRWATIIEFNRLDRIQKNNPQQKKPVEG